MFTEERIFVVMSRFSVIIWSLLAAKIQRSVERLSGVVIVKCRATT